MGVIGVKMLGMACRFGETSMNIILKGYLGGEFEVFNIRREGS